MARRTMEMKSSAAILMLCFAALPALSADTTDLGDAPDSTNNFGVPMYDVSLPEYVEANYPTVFNDGNAVGPFGPIHWRAKAVAYLGDDVTSEEEADIGPDQDGGNNIYPEFSASDGDLADDGVFSMPLHFSHMERSSFHYSVTVIEPNIPLYVNAWFDWNNDGDWDDVLEFCGYSAPEWAVQDQLLLFSEPGTYKVRSTRFMAWEDWSWPTPPIWMRITLSEKPWAGSGSGGSGPAGGYEYGETEDYIFEPGFPVYCFPSMYSTFCDWLESRLPACWCGASSPALPPVSGASWLYQCDGDANGDTQVIGWRVYSNDLVRLANSWQKKFSDWDDGFDPCADFDHKSQVAGWRVYTDDLVILANNWKKKDSELPGDCPRPE